MSSDEGYYHCYWEITEGPGANIEDSVLEMLCSELNINAYFYDRYNSY